MASGAECSDCSGVTGSVASAPTTSSTSTTPSSAAPAATSAAATPSTCECPASASVESLTLFKRRGRSDWHHESAAPKSQGHRQQLWRKIGGVEPSCILQRSVLMNQPRQIAIAKRGSKQRPQEYHAGHDRESHRRNHEKCNWSAPADSDLHFADGEQHQTGNDCQWQPTANQACGIVRQQALLTQLLVH